MTSNGWLGNRREEWDWDSSPTGDADTTMLSAKPSTNEMKSPCGVDGHASPFACWRRWRMIAVSYCELRNGRFDSDKSEPTPKGHGTGAGIKPGQGDAGTRSQPENDSADLHDSSG